MNGAGRAELYDGRTEPGLRDIATEVASAPCAVTSGSIPAWLSGSMYRQSGAAFPPPSNTIGFAYVHGLAHVAAVRFQDGGAHMTNAAVRTEAHARWKTDGAREWGNPHEITLGGGAAAPKALYDGPNPNVTVWKVGEGTLAALSEAPRGRVILLDESTLGTVGVEDMMDEDAVFLQAAHFFAEQDGQGFHAALYMEETGGGEVAFGYSIFHGAANRPPLTPAARLEVARFPEGQPPGDGSRLAYMHTLAVTANYVVLFGSSRCLDYATFLNEWRAQTKSRVGFFQLWPWCDEACALHVFRRSGPGGAQLTYAGERRAPEPLLVWHTANAFEKGGRLVVDVTCMRAPPPGARSQRYLMRLEMETATLQGTAAAQRQAQPAEATVLSGDAHEFPCVNPARYGLEHRYVYGLSHPYARDSALHKHDVAKGTARSWKGGDDHIPSEPIFVARPSADGALLAEDDGVVLAVVNIDSDDSSYVVVLDGESFEELARVVTPTTINHGLHSVFIPTSYGGGGAVAASPIVARY